MIQSQKRIKQIEASKREHFSESRLQFDKVRETHQKQTALAEMRQLEAQTQLAETQRHLQRKEEIMAAKRRRIKDARDVRQWVVQGN